MQKTSALCAVLAIPAFIFGILDYPWVAGILSLVAVFFGLSSLLGVKSVRKCILSCWCGERQKSVTRINSCLAVVSNLVDVDFVVDENGNAYSANVCSL